jgi:DNA-binding CsgD family transcriptional regulator
MFDVIDGASDLEPNAHRPLSRRQEECLRGVLELKSAKEIARDLGISPDAVEKHLKATRTKLGVRSSAEAARLFFWSRAGTDFPDSGSPDLAARPASEHQGDVPERRWSESPPPSEGITGALLLDRALTPRQTLLTIAAVSFVSIVGLLLLVACADGIRSLISG